jgi:hypothetical protein
MNESRSPDPAVEGSVAHTLPLFGDLPAATGRRRSARAGSLPLSQCDPAVAHLRAARRLSRSMRRLPDPLERRRAGQAICRHLLALLESPGER